MSCYIVKPLNCEVKSIYDILKYTEIWIFDKEKRQTNIQKKNISKDGAVVIKKNCIMFQLP